MAIQDKWICIIAIKIVESHNPKRKTKILHQIPNLITCNIFMKTENQMENPQTAMNTQTENQKCIGTNTEIPI